MRGTSSRKPKVMSDLPRDFLTEAYAIAHGRSMRLAQKEHVIAIMEYAEKLKARIDALARALEKDVPA